MFGWGMKRDATVVETVCSRLRPLFLILEQRLGYLPPELRSDPYVIGYIIGGTTLFAQIETGGKPSRELVGLVCLTAIQRSLGRLNLTMLDASHAMQAAALHPDAKRGSRAAALSIGVAAGVPGLDSEPEVVAAKQSLANMPNSLREQLQGGLQAQLGDRKSVV